MDRRQLISNVLKASGLGAASLTLDLPGWTQTAIAPALNGLSRESGIWRVNIFATVRDKNNEIVRGLTKDDFLLEDDGRVQEIQYFGQEASIPLSIGILFDIRYAMSSHQKEERTAAREFLARVMREQDRGFVVSYAAGVALNQPLTSSLQDLDRGIAALKWPTGPSQTMGGDPRLPNPGRPISMSTFLATKLFDAIGLSSDKVLRPQPGRKTLIVLSNGFDADSAYLVSGAIEAAQRAAASVYTLALESERLGNVKMERALGRVTGEWKTIADQTGGRHFAYDRKPLANAFGAIEDELRNQYLLGFKLEDPTRGFHSIRLTTRQKDFKVQARTQHYIGE